MFHPRLTMAAAIALLSACGSTGTGGGSSADVTLSATDVAIPAPALDQSQPVTVNTREDAAGPQVEGDDRVIITGMRSALRSGSLDSYLRALSEVSCGGSSTATAATAIPFSVSLVAEQSPDPKLRKFGEMTFIASYQLTSTDERFGGLSGLDLIADDKLLAVSDAGRFVWIDLNKDGTAPVSARLAPMVAVGGVAMGADAASEGLAINGSFALVSFEGDHRVLAFDIGRCGASASGAPIVFGDYGLPLTDAFADARIVVSEKEGSEPLAVTSDWYLFAGIERKVGQFNSLSGRPIEAEPEFNLRVGVNAPEFAGLDIVPDLRRNGAVRAFLVHRSTRSSNSSIVITETDMIRFRDDNAPAGPGEMAERARWRFSETGWRELGNLDRLGTGDSYEGIAAKQLSDGRVRLYLISDDDFDGGKRTLLTILDVPKPLR